MSQTTSRADSIAALTSAALSMAYTGSFDYAWRSFADGLANGRFSNALRK